MSNLTALMSTKGCCEPLRPLNAPKIPALDRWLPQPNQPKTPTPALPVAVLTTTINQDR
jgi:hypothetical protein